MSDCTDFRGLSMLMYGPNHALLLDEREELVIEDDVYKKGLQDWVKRVTGGWPTRDHTNDEEC